MDGGADGGTLPELVVFLKHFDALPDPRQRRKVICPLDEVLLLSLQEARPAAPVQTVQEGAPADDHLGDIFATLDAEAFQRCCVAWVAALTGVPSGVIAATARRCAGPEASPRKSRQGRHPHYARLASSLRF